MKEDAITGAPGTTNTVRLVTGPHGSLPAVAGQMHHGAAGCADRQAADR